MGQRGEGALWGPFHKDTSPITLGLPLQHMNWGMVTLSPSHFGQKTKVLITDSVSPKSGALKS